MTVLDPPLSRRSFRDPAGHVQLFDDRVLRLVYAQGEEAVTRLLDSPTAAAWLADGHLVPTRVVPAGERERLISALEPAGRSPASLVLEHERLPFPSYPFEWPAEMLHAAGRLTLEIAEGALGLGLGLKDATPYNILFRGTEPVFVDLLSFEARDPLDATWLPYAQFERTFLLPLLAARAFGLPPHEALLAHRDGLEPERVYRLSSWTQRLRSPFLSLVSIPHWLTRPAEARLDSRRPRPAADPAQARFVLGRVFRHLRRKLAAVAPAAGRSAWTGYCAGRENGAYLDRKKACVASILATARPRTVLDIGCNTGAFAALAARQGATVVAIDADPPSVGAAWRRARAEGLDILPLVVDLARPTPAVGWANGECASFLERARAGFDMVLLLAVLHHLLVTERVPLEAILDLVAELTTRGAVVEVVPPEDPLVRRLARGREDLLDDLSPERFEAASRRRFRVLGVEPLPGGHRRLYHLEKR